MLDLVHALAQRLGCVPGADGHGLLEDHRPGVDALVDEMDGDAGLGDAGSECVLDRGRAGEGGQERRVDVDCRVPLSADETNALTRLEEFLIWAAKYPVPLSADVLEKAEIKQLRTHRPTDPDVLNEIFERLLKLYPTQ